jgi:hypothetical protein
VLLIRRSGRVGALARAGLVLGGAGITFLAVAGLAQEKFFSGDFEQMPYFVVPGLATLVVGFALLGVAVLRSGVLPTSVSVLLLLGTLAMIGANEQTSRALQTDRPDRRPTPPHFTRKTLPAPRSPRPKRVIPPRMTRQGRGPPPFVCR